MIPAGAVGFRPALALAVCLAACACSADAPVVTLETVEGEEVTGPLTEIVSESVTVAGRKMPAEDVAELRFRSAVAGARGLARVYFRNGNLLCARIVGGTDAQLRVESPLLGNLELKVESLQGLLFPIPNPPAESILQQFILSKAVDQDQILLARGDTAGGTFREISDKELSFKSGDQESRKYGFLGENVSLAGLRFGALTTLKPMTGLVAMARFSDGSLLSGRLSGPVDDRMTLQMAEGTALQFSAAALQTVNFEGGRLVYLGAGGLAPSAVEEQPLIGGAPLVFGWRSGQAVSGGPLRLLHRDRERSEKREYKRGLGVHSYCRLSFDLKGEFAAFLCDVGLDLSAPAGAGASWSVLADGKETASGSAESGAPAQRLKLNLAGVKKLELICDFGPDKDDLGDRLNWANARLVKAKP